MKTNPKNNYNPPFECAAVGTVCAEGSTELLLVRVTWTGARGARGIEWYGTGAFGSTSATL